MPKSEVAIYEFNSFCFLEGKTIQFKIIGITERSIIISRKQAILEDDKELKWIKLDSSPKRKKQLKTI